MKIAIFGSYGNYDIGDEAMLTADLEYMYDNMHINPADIYIATRNIEYTSWYHKHNPKNCFYESFLTRFLPHPKRLREKISLRKRIFFENRLLTNKLRDADVVFITGGGTINTRDQLALSLKRMERFINTAFKCNKPIFMSGQTIGPLGINREHDRIASGILAKVDYLTVRDKTYSKKYLSLIGFFGDYFETFDDAFALQYQEAKLDSELDGFMRENPVWGVNVTDYTGSELQQKKFMAQLCDTLVNRYRVKLCFVSHHPNDYKSLCCIKNIMVNKREVVIPNTKMWRDRQLKKLISLCGLAIGGRYHFIVFSGTSRVPFIGMNGNDYSYIKQYGFASMIDKAEYILNPKDTWNMEVILSKVKQITKNGVDYSNMDSLSKCKPTSMDIFKEWFYSKVK